MTVWTVLTVCYAMEDLENVSFGLRGLANYTHFEISAA